jgi:hypothetical protein
LVEPLVELEPTTCSLRRRRAHSHSALSNNGRTTQRTRRTQRPGRTRTVMPRSMPAAVRGQMATGRRRWFARPAVTGTATPAHSGVLGPRAGFGRGRLTWPGCHAAEANSSTGTSFSDRRRTSGWAPSASRTVRNRPVAGSVTVQFPAAHRTGRSRRRGCGVGLTAQYRWTPTTHGQPRCPRRRDLHPDDSLAATDPAGRGDIRLDRLAQPSSPPQGTSPWPSSTRSAAVSAPCQASRRTA